MKKILGSLSSLALIVVFTVSASADPIVITPQVLRETLLQNNISILIGMNQVYQSKLNITVARAGLLPSLNLGAALQMGQSNFVLSTVSVLMPFLIPSNWFNYRQNQYLFEAEKHSYYLLKLNTFASAYSTMQLISEDMALRGILYRQYQNLEKIREVIAKRVELGLSSQVDLIQAQAAAQMAMVQLSQMDELLIQEHASFRRALALPMDQDFSIASVNTPESEVEGYSRSDLYLASLAKSPEYKQVKSMIQAAEEGKWNKVFAFISSAAITSTGSAGRSASFDPVMASGAFNLGFGYFPSVELGNAAIRQIKLRKKEIELEQIRIVEATLGSLEQVKIQLEQSRQAEEGLMKVFQIQLEKYNMGLTDILHVLDSQNSVTLASTSRVKSQMDLDGLRITLHRLMQTDEFAQIKGCKLKPVESAGFWGMIKDFFNSSSSQTSLEKLCS